MGAKVPQDPPERRGTDARVNYSRGPTKEAKGGQNLPPGTIERGKNPGPPPAPSTTMNSPTPAAPPPKKK